MEAIFTVAAQLMWFCLMGIPNGSCGENGDKPMDLLGLYRCVWLFSRENMENYDEPLLFGGWYYTYIWYALFWTATGVLRLQRSRHLHLRRVKCFAMRSAKVEHLSEGQGQGHEMPRGIRGMT